MSQFASLVAPSGVRSSSGGMSQDEIQKPDWGAMDYASDAALAIPRGLLGGASDIVNLVGLPFGEQVVDDRFGLMDESESMLGSFVEGASSFSVGFALGGGLGVGAKAAKLTGLTGAVAKAGTWVDDAARVAKFSGNVAKADRYAKYGTAIRKGGKFIEQGVFNSAFADFVSFDGNEQRLSNLVESFPSLQNPVTAYLAAGEDDGEIEGRLKNMLEGLFISGGTEGLFNLIRVTRAGSRAKAVGLDADRAVAEEYGNIRVEQRETLRTIAPNLTDDQADVANLLIDKQGLDRRKLLLAGEDVATEITLAAGASPVGKKGLSHFIQDGTAIVALFSKADISTVVHELAHVARRQLLDPSVDPAISGISEVERLMLEDWAGARNGWNVAADEKYARAIERYVYDGNAPRGMERTFRSLTNWMRNIYRDLEGSSIADAAPKQVKDILGKMLDQGPGVNPKLAQAMGASRAGGAGTLFQTETPEFKQFFDGSKVADPEGKPLVVYHGTASVVDKDGKPARFMSPAYGDGFEEFSEFLPNSHFGTAKAAQHRYSNQSPTAYYGQHTPGLRVYPVYLSIKNPLRVSDAAASEEASLLGEIIRSQKEGKLTEIDLDTARNEGAYKAVEKAGYDGLVYRNLIEDPGNDSWVAFKPEQIKSATGNRGTFDPDNPNILFQDADPVRAMEDAFGIKPEDATAESRVPEGWLETGGTGPARKAQRGVRARGPESMMSQMAMGLRLRTEMTAEDMAFATDLMNRFGMANFENIAMRFKKMNGPAGQYNFFQELLTIARGQNSDHLRTTFVHEVWHAMSTRLDDTTVREMMEDYKKAVNRWSKKLGVKITDLRLPPNAMHPKVKKAFDAGEIDWKTLYSLTNLDEWAVVNLTTATERRLELSKDTESVFGMARKLVADMLLAIKKAFGYGRYEQIAKEWVEGTYRKMPAIEVARATDMERRAFDLAKKPRPTSVTLFQSEDQPRQLGTFYSKLQQTIDSAPQRKMTADQLRGMLKTAGVKDEEMFWSGIDDVLKAGGKVDLDEVRARMTPVTVTETLKDPAKWATYQAERLVVPGGTEQRELLLRFGGTVDPAGFVPRPDDPERLIHPDLTGIEIRRNEEASGFSWSVYRNGGYRGRYLQEQAARLKAIEEAPALFKGPHWDESNVLAHVRFNDRTGPNGEKILFIEELQSDWHQQGREKGYTSDMTVESLADRLKLNEAKTGWMGSRLDVTWDDPSRPNAVSKNFYPQDNWQLSNKEREEWEAGGDSRAALELKIKRQIAEAELKTVRQMMISDAPFKSTDAWTGLAMKRMVAWAAERGYDGIAWTTGKQQSDRYRKLLEENFDRVEVRPHRTDIEGGTAIVVGFKGESQTFSQEFGRKRLPEVLGNKMGNEAMERLTAGEKSVVFKGDSLSLGEGQGYKVHYETILPKQLKEIGKKFGARVGEVDFKERSKAASEMKGMAIEESSIPSEDRVWEGDSPERWMLDAFRYKLDPNYGDKYESQSTYFEADEDAVDFAKQIEFKWIKLFDVNTDDSPVAMGTIDVLAAVITHNGRMYVSDAQFGKYSDLDFESRGLSFAEVQSLDEAKQRLRAEAVSTLGEEVLKTTRQDLGTQPYFPLTKELKESVLSKGLPLFQAEESPYARQTPSSAPDLGKPGGDPDAPINWGRFTTVEETARWMASRRPEVNYRSMTREDFMARATEKANELEGMLERSSADDFRRAVQGGHLSNYDLQQFLEFAEGVRITASRYASDLHASAKRIATGGATDVELANFVALESRSDLLLAATKQNQAAVARALNFKGVTINPRYNRNPRLFPELPTPGSRPAETPAPAPMPMPEAAPRPAEMPAPEAAPRPAETPAPEAAATAPEAAAPPESAPAPEAAPTPEVDPLTNPEVAARIAREIIEMAGGREAILDRINRIVEIGVADPMRTVRAAREARRGNPLVEYWMNSILSGPLTHAVNLTANTLTAVYLPLERALGAAIMGDRQTAEDSLRQIGFALSQFRDAFALARESFRDDRPILDSIGTRDDTNQRAISGAGMRQSRLLRRVAPAEGSRAEGILNNIGRVINIPTRLLQAEDEFFKQLNYRAAYRAELYSEAMRRFPGDAAQAAQWVETTFQRTIQDGQQYAQGVVLARAQQAASRAVSDGSIAPDGVPEFVARYMADTNNWDPALGALSRRALEFARTATFQTPLERDSASWFSRGGFHLQRAANDLPALRFLFPFVRTPTNLINFAIARTLPGSMVNARRLFNQTAREAANPRMRADLAGRLAFATASTGLIATYALAGNISGNGPKNKEERRAMEQAGWQPYSIRVGDKWVSYRRMDPFSTVIGLVADLVESHQYDELRKADENLSNGVYTVLLSIARNITNKSYLTGMTNFVNALSNPDQYAQTVVNNYAGSLVPFSGAMGQAKMGVADDDVMREVRTMVDAVRNKIPGLAEGLAPQRNILGDPVKRPRAGGVGIDLVSPFTYTTVNSDKILQEFAKVGHGFAPPREARGAIDLTAFSLSSGQQAYDRWMELHGEVRIGGRTLRQSLERLIADPNYQKLSPAPSDDYDSPRVRRLRSIISMYREAAYRKLLTESPELREAEGIEQSNRRALRSGTPMDQLQQLVR